MGEWIKRGVMLALVGAALWKGWDYWRGRNAAHRFTFKVEGPMSCRSTMEYSVGEVARTENETMPWEGSEGIDSRGHQTVRLSVRVPNVCHVQPDQVRCEALRDGAPWRRAVATRISDPANGEVGGVWCTLSADAASGAD